MPEKGNFWGDFAAGAFQGYTSEQERHRQILDQQLRQAAQERTTALALAQAGITDPAVFEMMRPQQAPPPGQGTAGGAIVDLLGKLGGRLPGKVGEVAGKLKAPTYQTDAPGISGPEYGALAEAMGTARTTESAAKLKDTIALEKARNAADPRMIALQRLFPGAFGEAQAPAAPAAPQAPAQAGGDSTAQAPSAPAPDGQDRRFKTGFSEQEAVVLGSLGIHVPTVADVEKAKETSRRQQEADRRTAEEDVRKARKDRVDLAKFNISTGQGKPEDFAIVNAFDQTFKTPEQISDDKMEAANKRISAVMENARKALDKASGTSGTEADKSAARRHLMEARRIAIKNGLEVPSFEMGNPKGWEAGGGSVETDFFPDARNINEVNGIVRLYDLASVRGDAKRTDKQALVGKLNKLVSSGDVKPAEAAQVLIQRAGFERNDKDVVAFSEQAARTAGVTAPIEKSLPGAPPKAQAKSAKPTLADRSAQLKADIQAKKITRAEAIKTLKDEGY